MLNYDSHAEKRLIVNRKDHVLRGTGTNKEVSVIECKNIVEGKSIRFRLSPSSVDQSQVR